MLKNAKNVKKRWNMLEYVRKCEKMLKTVIKLSEKTKKMLNFKHTRKC